MSKITCRACNHNHWWLEAKENKSYCKYLSCSCVEWVPSDNLKYLEWKYNKIKVGTDGK